MAFVAMTSFADLAGKALPFWVQLWEGMDGPANRACRAAKSR